MATTNTTTPLSAENATPGKNITVDALLALLPKDVASFATFLLGFAAIGEWAKLFAIGLLLETARRIFLWVKRALTNALFVTAEFDEWDDSYDWMMLWLSKHPSWQTAREVRVSTSSFGLQEDDDEVDAVIDGEEADADLAAIAASADSKTRSLSFLPAYNVDYSIWYKRHWIKVSRVLDENNWRRHETLTLQIFGFRRTVLNELLLEARKEYKKAMSKTISIYICESDNNWVCVASRPKRPLNSIVLDPGVKELILEDAKDFLGSRAWYAERGIPFRRGYLLYGAPGSGKTSVIHSLAGELGLDVYVVTLSRSGLDDTSLNRIISAMPARCIALMEDIDAAFHQGVVRTVDGGEDDAKKAANKKAEGGEANAQAGAENGAKKGTEPVVASRVTLSGLLNALDGIAAQEGRLLFATTNRYSALDPALTRPGRMDLHVEFRLASRHQAKELFRCFFPPTGQQGENSEARKTPEKVPDSGLATPKSDDASEEKPLIDFDGSEPTATSSTVEPGTIPAHNAVVSLRLRKFAPKLTRAQADELAEQFGEAIPERAFSMASLQGLLMMYKTRPFEVVQEAPAWVERELKEREKKAKA